MDQLAFDIARVREDQYVSHIANNSNNRGRLLMAQAYHHLAWGLTQLAAYVEAEPPAQFRNCSNAVVVELVSFVATIFQPTALNGHDPAKRWRENVELWITPDNCQVPLHHRPHKLCLVVGLIWHHFVKWQLLTAECGQSPVLMGENFRP